MPAMDEKVASTIKDNGIIAVLDFADRQEAVPVAKALADGGIRVIELALRSPAAEPSIELIAGNVPEIVIGVGTIIQKGQAERVKNLGAVFGLSPGLNPDIVGEAAACGLPFVPGIATAGELEAGLGLDCNVFKVFPALFLGGAAFIKSLNTPYAHLGPAYIPLGGITEHSIEEYASLPEVIGVGGTWIAGKSLIAAGDYRKITENAAKAVRLWGKLRSLPDIA